MDILNTWDEEIFFKLYWGKKPCIIKNFITSKDCQKFDIDELSTLALENDIVTRLIQYNHQCPEELSLDHGPFEEDQLIGLPKSTPWSLLIQDADKKTDLFSNILKKFNKIPAPFFDDVMISIGNINSGTGPHLDWYNVFILQAKGTKNWKVETQKRSFQDHDDSIYENLEVKILKNFHPYTEHDLTAGELLYIPPGHGHHGTSKSDLSMSFSIGYQGPRLTTMIETYLSKLIGNIHEDQRVNFDPNQDSSIDLSNWPKDLPIENKDIILELIEIAKEQDY